jgi:hypothetical protein
LYNNATINSSAKTADKPTPTTEQNQHSNPVSGKGEPPNNSNNLNNQKQKDAISNKYNPANSSILSINKHINSNFNVIDEIAEEDLFSRASRVVSNGDLELIILQNQSEQQKSSEKIKNKNSNVVKPEKISTKPSQNLMKSSNKSSANIGNNNAMKNNNLKSYIKENKQKLTFEPGLSINTNYSTESSIPSNELQTTRNTRTNRISPDTAIIKKDTREATSKGI